MLSPAHTYDAETRRRRVRKGTRSCWECRRRKVKCRFNDPQHTTCINCAERETACISQKYTEVVTPKSPPRLATGSVTSDSSGRHSDLGEPYYPAVPPGDLFDDSAATNAHELAVTANGTATEEHGATGEPSVIRFDSSLAGEKVYHPYIAAHYKSARERHAQISRYLCSLLPPAHLRSLLAHESPGASWVLSFAHTREDQIAGRVEPNWSLASASWPTPEAHPVIVARRLMQYSICMQTISPNFDAARFRLPPDSQPCEMVRRFIGAVSSLVTNDDDLVSCAEGIETLALLAMFQTESGHLRRAWMTNRRALSFCHLMGVDRPSTRRPVRSRAGHGDPGAAPSMAVLWRRLNCADRYYSLVLGLPVSSHNDAFARANFLPWASPLEQLDAEHAVVCRRIGQRNELSLASSEACDLTAGLDSQLGRASEKLGSSLWSIPDFSLDPGRNGTQPPAVSPAQFMVAHTVMKLQVQHYTILILLHLPYLLQNYDDERHAESRKACKRASRELLERFLAFREENCMNLAGRPIDYATLIAGMTLPLTYLERLPGDEPGLSSDRDLLERTILIFRAMASFKQDRLAVESADTIHQLLPLLQEVSEFGSQEPLTLKVPFLGTVAITHSLPKKHSLAQTAESPFTLGRTDAHGLGFHQQLSFSLEQDQFGLHTSDPSGSLFDLGEGDQVLLGASSQSTDPEGWVFQGIDTVYWSTLEQSINGFAEDQTDNFSLE